MSELILTRGIPASGKTSWSLAWVAEAPDGRVRVNRDDLRRMLHGVSHGLTYAQEKQITATQVAIVKGALAKGQSVVVDDTNLRSKFVREWMKIHPVTFQDFEVALHEARLRDMFRTHPVGTDVIDMFWTRFTKNGKLPPPPKPDPPTPNVGATYTPDLFLDQAFCVDIDGTLAHIPEGGRSPYDGSRVHEDILDIPVASMVAHLGETYHIIIVTGRSEEYRAVTEKWLQDHFVNYDELYMRPAGDRRKDHIVKLEIFDEHLRDRYNVLGVFDDRNRVVEGWRSIGLKVYQVADGDF